MALFLMDSLSVYVKIPAFSNWKNSDLITFFYYFELLDTVYTWKQKFIELDRIQ